MLSVYELFYYQNLIIYLLNLFIFRRFWVLSDGSEAVESESEEEIEEKDQVVLFFME